MQLVKIHNTHSTNPMRLVHDGMGTVTIPPGAEVILDFSYATVAFGHPAAMNAGVNKDRDAALAQARTYWGMYPGMNEDEWDAKMPSFEVHDMEGNRIYMVLEDPEGLHQAPELFLEAETGGSLQDQIAALQAQTERLLKIASANASNDLAAPTAEPSPLPTEEPTTTTTVDPTSNALPDGTLPEDLTAELESPAERNEQRDELPKPRKRVVTKDSPRTTKSGA
ncbi:MAG: hypothetical protein LC118_13860 [Dehalococcoidia bacterium]|nr:hypothetical protein [Dehalococcoidia bacterium]